VELHKIGGHTDEHFNMVPLGSSMEKIVIKKYLSLLYFREILNDFKEYNKNVSTDKHKIHPSIRPSVRPSVRPSTCLPACLSI